MTARDVCFRLFHVSCQHCLNIAFLAHQTLVAIDAVVRTVIRSVVTHSRLLEWETATEAELGIRKRTPVDIYLNWIPALSICLALGLFFRPEAAPYAFAVSRGLVLFEVDLQLDQPLSASRFRVIEEGTALPA